MFDFLFNPKGRISRKGWWLGYLLPYLAVTITLGVLGGIVPALAFLGTIATLFYLWPSNVAVPVKRFHDLGMTGWWQLGFIVGFIVATSAFSVGVGISAAERGLENEFSGLSARSAEEQQAVLLEAVGGSFGNPVVLVSAILFALLTLAYLYFMGIKQGQPGENRFGPDPHASGRGFAD